MKIFPTIAASFFLTAVGMSAANAAEIFDTPTLPAGGIQYGPDEYATYNTNTTGPAVVPGFTFNGFSGIVTTSSGYLPQPPAGLGNQAAFIQTYPGGSGQLGGSIVWSVSGLDIGKTYTLSFYDVAINTVPSDPITISAAGGNASVYAPTSSWALDSYKFTAQTAAENINFLGAVGANGSNEATALTDLSLAVPEPATWAMLLLGFFGIGFMMRGARRKDAVATA